MRDVLEARSAEAGAIRAHLRNHLYGIPDTGNEVLAYRAAELRAAVALLLRACADDEAAASAVLAGVVRMVEVTTESAAAAVVSVVIADTADAVRLRGAAAVTADVTAAERAGAHTDTCRWARVVAADHGVDAAAVYNTAVDRARWRAMQPSGG